MESCAKAKRMASAQPPLELIRNAFQDGSPSAHRARPTQVVSRQSPHLPLRPSTQTSNRRSQTLSSLPPPLIPIQRLQHLAAHLSLVRAASGVNTMAHPATRSIQVHTLAGLAWTPRSASPALPRPPAGPPTGWRLSGSTRSSCARLRSTRVTSCVSYTIPHCSLRADASADRNRARVRYAACGGEVVSMGWLGKDAWGKVRIPPIFHTTR